ncbi:glutamine-hydrolyzing GMP synthase [Blochmannia endosymbiont of Colobopsis nipponica]|uniref:glutamine-hydrolyzing GMP synthase n=1 Tax=Blochmannia endosymbiont of Colobopsis nipponica TaxID=2681987 RepID=UPI0017841A2B|nr:glutamine-hydrolyzing GMP synthase [Blochmannia endosymbiont of Colobopsis nipponica]QOI10945.1 glutamine-hydrolyzing GMP synthase [Blochmannia endosymbiont of Colobopsis nipponica]
MCNFNFYKGRILILDFGSQYVRLIAKIIRELGVYCEIWPWNVTELQIKNFHPSGIILSGGPETAMYVHSSRAPACVFCHNIPVLGICYGMQTMVVQLGGKVQTNNLQREFGSIKVNIIKNDNLLINNIFDLIDKKGNPILEVWMSHNDTVSVLPPDFIILAATTNCPTAIIVDEQRSLYGVQFHPEVTHTIQGRRILKRFVIDICQCKPTLKLNLVVEDILLNIRKLVGYDQVVLGWSGGVDSSVTALLLHRAIGEKLICLFVDNGLLRLDEEYEIIKMFCKDYNINIICLSEAERFFNALVGVLDPEEKRKIIGRVFIEIFKEQMQFLGNVKWLAQGTICSDVIESTQSNNIQISNIKSHHNVIGLPKDMTFGLIEPIKYFFKDEVRDIGLKIGLPDYVLYRHPFPGPGFGVRIIGEVKKEYCDLLRQADSIFIEELKKSNLYYKVSQAFAVFLSVRSVGIMGDNRQYGWVIALRAVNSIDFMTSQYTYLPNDFLTVVSNRIINEIKGISRVVYDISSKPPSTIEWE